MFEGAKPVALKWRTMEGDKLVEFCPFYLEGIILHSYCLQTMPEQWILNDIGQNHAREPPLRKGPVHHMKGSNSLPGSLFLAGQTYPGYGCCSPTALSSSLVSRGKMFFPFTKELEMLLTLGNPKLKVLKLLLAFSE